MHLILYDEQTVVFTPNTFTCDYTESTAVMNSSRCIVLLYYSVNSVLVKRMNA
jgi:hypothetical protein